MNKPIGIIGIGTGTGNNPRNPRRSFNRRPSKYTLPPDVVDGAPPTPPVFIRLAKVRYATSARQRSLTGSGKSPSQWQSIEVNIPREIAEVTGIEAGMTLCLEAYADGRVRMYPAGDILSRDEEAV